MEEIMLALAAAIVKTAFKFWTKDSDLATNTTDELTDLVKDKVVGRVNQRKARQWIEELEEMVNQRLLKYMDYEFVGLPENERQATVLAVADTLAKAEVGNQELWDQDLDPLQLEQFLKNSIPNADKDLGYQARGLYTRLLPEACAYVVSLSASLPEFQLGAFSELLKRDTAIITRLDEILKLLPPQLMQSQNPEVITIDVYNAFTTAYRRQVVNRLDHLRIFGVDAFTQQYPLSLAYINLSVYSHRIPQHRAKQKKPNIDTQAAISIETVLHSSNRLFLSGQAGSGKTTILQWLAVRAARKDFPQDLAQWNNYEPFFIPLRRYIDRTLPSPAQFVEAVGRNISAQMPIDWVERRLVTGTALILIDGIDELPPEKYIEVKQWVIALANDYPDCAYIITSRPGAVNNTWLATAEFSSATLAPMSSKSVRIFVQQWITSMLSETVDREEHDLLSGYERPIARALLTGRHLRELASTPLLCALLCALYYTRNGELPSDRMGVYAAALDMLQRRDTERGIKSDSKLGRAESRIILQDIAYWLIRNGLTDADIPRILRQIDLSKKHLHKVIGNAEEIYRQLLIRSGLLQEPAVNRVSFIHRTFQEYLAARAAIDGDNIEELTTHALDARWTQVFIMAAGHASPVQREQLLGSLLVPQRRGKKTDDTIRLALVALACLETCPSVPAHILNWIREAASPIIPPDSEEDVNLLVKAGDLALDILANVEVDSVHQAAMVLEVIRRLETEEGLQLMAEILRQQPDLAWTFYFKKVWQAFNPEDVANIVIQVSEVKRLHVILPRCEPIISMLTGIEAIYCTASGAVPDLTCLQALPHVKALAIHSTGVVDLSPLADRKDLTIQVILRHLHSESPIRSDDLLKMYVVGIDGLGVGSRVSALTEKEFESKQQASAVIANDGNSPSQ